MNHEVIILVAEDDEGHAGLIRKNLGRAGVTNEIVHFRDGQEILDFLFGQGKGWHRQPEKSYILLLDIRMPKVDGIEVLQRVKADPELKKMPVMIVTTTDDPAEVDRCHRLGCNNYLTKPIDYATFVNAVQQLGLFLSVVELPKIGESTEEQRRL
jgi:CheY-like chemotaxis protein